MPLSIQQTQKFNQSGLAATPVISGVFGTGALLLDQKLFIAQGVGDKKYHNGNPSNGPRILNSSQELPFTLNKINQVDQSDLQGVMGANLQSTYKKRQSQKRVNLTNLTHQAYTGSAPSPKDLANLASNVLGRGKTAQDLADELLNDPETSAAIDQSYGASLKDLSVEDIVTGATTNLRRSQPSPAEINSWKVAVNNGLKKTWFHCQSCSISTMTTSSRQHFFQRQQSGIKRSGVPTLSSTAPSARDSARQGVTRPSPLK